MNEHTLVGRSIGRSVPHTQHTTHTHTLTPWSAQHLNWYENKKIINNIRKDVAGALNILFIILVEFSFWFFNSSHLHSCFTRCVSDKKPAL